MGQEVISGYLSDNVAITQAAAAAAANTTDVTSAELDMAGYDSVMFIGVFGTPATNNKLLLRHGDTSGGEVDTTASEACTASIGVVILDVQHVQKRYVTCVAKRGTSTTLDQLIAIRYNARDKAVALAATVVAGQFNGPTSA